MIRMIRAVELATLFSVLLFSADLYAAHSCQQVLGVEKPGLRQMGSFTGQEVSAVGPNGFEGSPIESYSSFAQLKAGFLELKVGESAVIGSLGHFDDVQDFVMVRKTAEGLKVFLKRKYFTIEQARHEFYSALEREQLAQAGVFGALKLPRVIGYEGNELFLEFVEGVQLREFLKAMPFDEKQENVFLQYQDLVKGLKRNLDDTIDPVDGTRAFQVWEYEEPQIGGSYDILGADAYKLEARGGLVLLDANREGRLEESYGEQGAEMLSLSPFSVLVSKEGALYYSLVHWRSLSLSAFIGADVEL